MRFAKHLSIAAGGRAFQGATARRMKGWKHASTTLITTAWRRVDLLLSEGPGPDAAASLSRSADVLRADRRPPSLNAIIPLR